MKKVIGIVSLVVIGVLALTNPSEKAHKDKIKKEMVKVMEPMRPSGGWELIGWNMGMTLVERKIDTEVENAK